MLSSIISQIGQPSINESSLGYTHRYIANVQATHTATVRAFNAAQSVGLSVTLARLKT